MPNYPNTRPHGVEVFPMPEEVGGPSVFGQYALLIKSQHEVRMVHTEGVAYLVTDEKPWTWNDWDNGSAQPFTIGQLITMAAHTRPVDLADWVRSHNGRLESNFSQVYGWAVEA